MTPLDDIVRTSARAHERDRYLAALLAPRRVRSDLVALAAFAGEVGRLPLTVNEPMMARIRMQWWRERIETRASGGHPVAAAIIDVIARHGLSPDRFVEIIDGHEDRLPDRPFASDAELLANIDTIDGNLFALASRICGTSVPDNAAIEAGRAYGLSRVGIELPSSLAHGQVMLPMLALDANGRATTSTLAPAIGSLAAAARRHHAACLPQINGLPRLLRCPFLPLALVEPYLHALERNSFETHLIEVNPLARVWRLLRGHWTGALR